MTNELTNDFTEPGQPPVETPRRGFEFSRVLFGLIMMTVGVLLLAERLGHMQLLDLSRCWPLVLVLLGLNLILRPQDDRRTRGGIWLISIGLWLEAIEYHWLGLTFN